MYGSGKPAAAPAPPVPHDSASNAVIMPSADDARLDPRRRRRPVAGREVLFLAIEHQLDRDAWPPSPAARRSGPAASGASLLPKPPPMYWEMTRTLACGMPRPLAKPSRAALTPCVETQAVRLIAVPLADRAVRLEADVRDDVRRVGLLDDVRGLLEAGRQVAGFLRLRPAGRCRR